MSLTEVAQLVGEKWRYITGRDAPAWPLPAKGKYFFSSMVMKFIETVMWAEHGTWMIPAPAFHFGSSLSECSVWIHLLPLFQATKKTLRLFLLHATFCSSPSQLYHINQIPSLHHTNLLILFVFIILFYFFPFEGGWGKEGWNTQPPGQKIPQKSVIVTKISMTAKYPVISKRL